MFRKMLIGAIAATVLFAVPAAAQYNITVTPGTVVPGGTVTITGDQCASNAIITVTLTQLTSQRAVGDTIEVGSGQANEDGEYSVDVTIPADAEPGEYELSVFCDGSFVQSARITVAGPSTPTTQPPAPPGGQPSTPGGGDIVRTGSDLNGLGLLGAALLLGGGAVLFATRNRRHATG
jgi:LPXTG-motif cell wall-anchored protein